MRRSAKSELALIFVVFFASGMAGLIYQVVWSRLLTLVIGVSIFAITTVICTFMAGLAVGSYLIGRWGERWRDPLVTYGVVEAAIGIYAACTPWIFELFEPLYVWAFNEFDRTQLNIFRVVLSSALLLIPTALMGGTLPLLSRAVFQLTGREASGVGFLYAVNTFGAVVGTALAGFVLLSSLGIHASLYLSAALNIGIALLIFALRRFRQPSIASPAPAEDRPVSPSEARFILIVFFLSGFAALGYEILWTRALLVYLKASTYAFSLMLSVYLLGIAAGSMSVSRWAQGTRRPLLVVALCQVAIALSVVAGMMIFPHVDEIGRVLTSAQKIDSFAKAVVFMFTEAALVLFVPTFFMGAMFPFGVAAFHASQRTIGRSVGSLYAMNTAGNIAGAIVVGFFSIAILGVRNSLVVLAALNIALAALVLAWSSRRLAPKVALATAAIVVIVAFQVWIPEGIFYRTLLQFPGTRIVFYREGASDTVAVIERVKQKDRTLIYSDGRGAAGTSTLPWNLYFGHLPMVLHEDPEEVLHICYGSGNSVLALTRHDPERIDVVELSPHVREASDSFWTNEGVVHHPRVNLIIEDGRNFVLGTSRVYDVISLEPPNIFTAGVVNLYTKEFYSLAKRRLKPDGIMVQWLPTIQLSEADRGMLIRAFADAFEHVTIWQQLSAPTLLLVGSRKPLEIDVEKVEEILSRPSMRADVDTMGIGDARGFLSFFLLDDPSVRRLVADYEPVQDDRTVVDYSIPRFVGSGYGFSIFTYPVVDEDGNNPSTIGKQRAREYASWGDPASEIISDPQQAERVDRAIRFRQEHGRAGSDINVTGVGNRALAVHPIVGP